MIRYWLDYISTSFRWGPYGEITNINTHVRTHPNMIVLIKFYNVLYVH